MLLPKGGEGIKSGGASRGLRIQRQEQDQLLVMELEGRVDAITAAELEQALSANQAPAMIVDCTAMDFISSAGLRVFLTHAKNMKKRGARLALCGMSADVFRVFEITGFTSIFTICKTRAEAVTAAQPAG